MNVKNITEHPITTMLGGAAGMMSLAYHCVCFYYQNQESNKLIVALGMAAMVIGALSKDK